MKQEENYMWALVDGVKEKVYYFTHAMAMKKKIVILFQNLGNTEIPLQLSLFLQRS